MIIGNTEQFKGYALVCFIDVLGFSNDILKNWNNEESNPLNRILSVKSKIPIFNCDVDHEQNNGVRQYICRVNSFSDSVTICFGFKKLTVGDFFLGIESLINNIIHIWELFIDEGFTIRGAIDFGDVYWDRNELIGPPFIHAYKLESEIAKTSRVIISSSFNKHLKNLFQEHRNSGLDEHLIKRFRKDQDGYIIIDPMEMYNNVMVNYSDENKRLDILAKLTLMKESVSSSIIQYKYIPLINIIKNNNRNILTPEDFGAY